MQKFGHIYFQTPYLAFLSFSNVPIGTVRGFDEAWTAQISVTCRVPYPPFRSYSQPLEDKTILISVSRDSFPDLRYTIDSIFIKGDFDNWGPGVQAHLDFNGNFSAMVQVKKSFVMKFLINGSLWFVSQDFTIAKDSQGNLVNVVNFNKETRVHENTCDFRKYFNDLHVQLNRDYPVAVTRMLSSDVAVVHRFTADFSKGYVLLCGLDFDGSKHEDSKSFNIDVLGHIEKLERVFTVEHGQKIIDDVFFKRV